MELIHHSFIVDGKMRKCIEGLAEMPPGILDCDNQYNELLLESTLQNMESNELDGFAGRNAFNRKKKISSKLEWRRKR